MKWNKFTCIFYKNNEEIYKEDLKNKLKSSKKLEFTMLDFETTIDLEEGTFLRENEEYIFFLNLKNKNCMVELKQESISFDVMVEEANLEILNDKIVLEYFIETDEARNKIVIKERVEFNE